MTRAVLVTGASTGIGRKIVERLATQCFVYAGARKDQDLAALGKIPNVQAVRLDVTNSRDVEAAVRIVANGPHRLCGLVNNAGIATLGSVVDADEHEFELVMQVNACGTYRVTKAFVPLIAVARGRIITMGSISGILAPANLSAYSMSKHAVEAFTDALAAELEPVGVHVSVIEPGNVKTQIAANAIKRLGRNPGLPDLAQCREPDDVAAVVGLALFEPRPKRRYLVVSNEDEARLTLKKQIAQLVQLNEGHTHTLDRSALVEMLDGELALARPKPPAPAMETVRGLRLSPA